MKKIIIIVAFILLKSLVVFSQGCIAIRSLNGFGQYNLTDNAFTNSQWQLNMTNRYFTSSRDFKENIDQKTPAQNKSLNETYTLDISLSKLLKDGWSLNLALPVSANTRTTSLEHGGPNTPRRATHSFGAGDLRFTVYKWLLKPVADQKWNLQAGLGIKFATGDYKYQDYFYRNDSTPVLSAVNPGIQLGDGGTGIITELNSFYTVSKKISLYGNLYYLISPREQNGTGYTQGRTPTTLQVKAGAVETSVPDVYSVRAGVYINLDKVSFSAGIRDEGSPVNDLIGGSNGIRRAGHNLSVEPGIIYKMKKVTLYAYAPIVIGRRIKQNVPDKKMTALTGIYTVGAGGTPDYILFAGISFKL